MTKHQMAGRKKTKSVLVGFYASKTDEAVKFGGDPRHSLAVSKSDNGTWGGLSMWSQNQAMVLGGGWSRFWT